MNKIVLVFMLLPLSLFSQEIKKIDDSTVKVTTKEGFFFNTKNERIKEQDFNDSLKSGLYVMNIKKLTKDSALFCLVKKYMDSSFLGKKVPQIDFFNVNQEKVRLVDNKCFMLIFWNTLCAPCRKELMVLDSLAAIYTNITFWAITSDSVSTVKDFLKTHDYKNLVFIPNYNNEFGKVFPVNVWPTNVLLNENQEIECVFYDKNVQELVELIRDFSKRNKELSQKNN